MAALPAGVSEQATAPTPTVRKSSRRGFLKAAGLLGSTAGLLGRPGVTRAAPPPFPTDTDPTSLLNKLARRMTNGANENDYALVRARGYEGFIDHHLAYQAIPDTAIDSRLFAYPTLSMTYEQMLGTQALLIRNERIEASILRATYSERQLFERMVEFWTDYFNVEMAGERLMRYKAVDDRDVIRPNAMGSFRNLVHASARSAAMLHFLNNDLNQAGRINENYARELLELHTLGVDGGYTQQDVIEVARSLTGWTYYPDDAGTLAGTFRFDETVHDTGPKLVLGQNIPARSGPGAIQDGNEVLNMLLSHPSTARHLSSRLCRWFLGPDVAQSHIDSVAAVYTATSGNIRSMIRALLRPNALAMAAPKFKRPWHFCISCLRSVPSTITTAMGVSLALSSAGMTPFGWPTPDGYPDRPDFWSGMVITRWNFPANLTNSNMGGLSIDAALFFAGLTTADQMMTKIDNALFGGEMPPYERDRIRQHLAQNPAEITMKRDAICLSMATPTFQWY